MTTYVSAPLAYALHILISTLRLQVEQDRLDLIHETTLLVCGGKTLLAPVQGRNDVQRVLDLGTGTGIWAIDYANENPHAEVLGIDLR